MRIGTHPGMREPLDTFRAGREDGLYEGYPAFAAGNFRSPCSPLLGIGNVFGNERSTTTVTNERFQMKAAKQNGTDGNTGTCTWLYGSEGQVFTFGTAADDKFTFNGQISIPLAAAITAGKKIRIGGVAIMKLSIASLKFAIGFGASAGMESGLGIFDAPPTDSLIIKNDVSLDPDGFVGIVDDNTVESAKTIGTYAAVTDFFLVGFNARIGPLAADCGGNWFYGNPHVPIPFSAAQRTALLGLINVAAIKGGMTIQNPDTTGRVCTLAHAEVWSDYMPTIME